MQWPTVDEIEAALREVNAMECEDGCIDVRLQVYSDGTWALRWGNSQYDQDGCGYWGVSGVPGNNDPFGARGIAQDLLSQAEDEYAMIEETT